MLDMFLQGSFEIKNFQKKKTKTFVEYLQNI